jgi:hypothetical protein
MLGVTVRKNIICHAAASVVKQWQMVTGCGEMNFP